MHQYQILYWRDIPAQVRVFDGRKPVSRTMPAHFQGEIDRVAMAEGLGARAEAKTAPFQPEGGAYAQGHGHDH